jgi:hypothetical protein
MNATTNTTGSTTTAMYNIAQIITTPYAVMYGINPAGELTGNIVEKKSDGTYVSLSMDVSGVVPAGADGIGAARMTISAAGEVLLTFSIGGDERHSAEVATTPDNLAVVLAAQSDAAVDASMRVGAAMGVMMVALADLGEMHAAGASVDQMAAKTMDALDGIQTALGGAIPTGEMDSIKKLLGEQFAAMVKSERPRACDAMGYTGARQERGHINRVFGVVGGGARTH